MTGAQQTESSSRSRTSDRELPLPAEHDALNETATMSSYGLREHPSVAISANGQSAGADGGVRTTNTEDAHTQTTETHSIHNQQASTSFDQKKIAGDLKVKAPIRRIQFGEFAEQLRQQQYFENRKRTLQQRKRVLQKIITLSARLHRVSSWIGDGLVEITEEPDAVCFVRLHQHMQNLIDLSHSQWDNELNALDPLGRPNSPNSKNTGITGLLPKLSSTTLTDVLDLLSHLRSDPRFLAAKFKALPNSQIVTLWSVPRYSRQDSNGSEYGYLPRAPGRRPHQRIQSYSKMLESYASSFERSNPLAFLLFNMYGTNQSSVDAENQLRLSTWSTVCADLMLTSPRAYSSLALPLLDCFASLYEWRARDSVELFLMDILQRGAFLLDDGNSVRRFLGRDAIITSAAQEFFDEAVHKLFEIFVKYEGRGFPTGATQFASAVLAKLPFIEQQMSFRGMFFSNWFLEHFLKLALSYPENESMLLNFHVSSVAREKILFQLWKTIMDRVHDVFSPQPIRPVDKRFRINVEIMVGTTDLVESTNPYLKNEVSHLEIEDHAEASITISIREIIQVLEALSPQAIHGVKSDHYLFERGSIYGRHLQANGRFDRLKADLLQQVEAGPSTSESHPCQEQWLQLDIDKVGRPTVPQEIHSQVGDDPIMAGKNLDCAQQAALRLFRDRISESTALTSTYRSDLLQSLSLEKMFLAMERGASAKLDPIDFEYWAKASDTLHKKYPLSICKQNDSRVLHNIFEDSKAAQSRCRECCSKLEIQLSVMEGICLRIRSTIDRCVERFESLRLKIWYIADVVLSKHYDDAKNIARALNHMADLNRQNVKPSNSSFISNRPMSSASSMFNMPYEDTMNMMKASSANGGPGKLADKQIELTENWLDRTHIENFCKGEERIHRFCMEVYNVAKSLVGETLTESPVLWSSELFARERSLYDIRSFSVTSAPASTRPASVMSDTVSNSHRFARPVASLRMTLEDRRTMGSSKIRSDCLPPELAPSIGSLSRAHSATTAESVSSIFSPLASNARSLTSASVYSRTSVFNDPILTRLTDTGRAKTKFLEKVQQVLICLLLSDLGCPVWSCGSETDAMLDSSRTSTSVNSRLKRRMLAETIARRSESSRTQNTSSRNRSRSKSVSMLLKGDLLLPVFDSIDSVDDTTQYGYNRMTNHLAALLTKMSQQVDPMEKLAAAEEFYDLSLTTIGSESIVSSHSVEDYSSHAGSARRHSVSDHAPTSSTQQEIVIPGKNSSDKLDAKLASVHDIVQHLKSDLAKLRPKTLFRDLQYISAFVPSENTDNTSRGKALLQLGLAALAYKDEVCRSMVDVAHDMLSQNRDPSIGREPMSKVAEFWMCAAREGNAVAQRELASLYLSRPDLLPVVSLPLFKASQIFQPDMLWHGRHYENKNTQSLCLALHWMQQASANGDRLAQLKLEERSEGLSIQ